MAFPFRMTFTGLCALVPNTNGTEGRVLLVDASTASGELDSHAPWLRYQGQKYSLAGTEVTLHLTNPQPPALQTFRPVLPIPGGGPHVPAPQTDDEQAAFWIADLAKAGAVLRNECLAPQRPEFVASRIKLNAGHLFTSRIIEDQSDQSQVVYHYWSLRVPAPGGPSVPDFNRAMAAQFSVNAMIDGGQIAISDGTILTLAPTAGEATVEVGNTCSECDDIDGVLEDFAWFYVLANPTTQFVPVRGGAGVSDTMCPPARFTANPDA